MFFNPKIALGAALIAAMSLSGCVANQERIAEQAKERAANPGPCPRAFALYEASRTVQFNGREAYKNVGFTAEMNGVRSLCRYFSDSPIDANVEIDMAFGRGPSAQGATHTYNYFVAVTRKNIAVMEKQYFPITVTFPPGVTQMQATEDIAQIIIPRAKEGTSGANFEIIVGFELTPEQLAFNEAGKRFRVSAGAR